MLFFLPTFVVFFLPPVSVDGSADGTSHVLATREFLQQILPASKYPKTRVWGYGVPGAGTWNGENDPITFHNPAATIEARQNVELKIAFLNDLVKGDPDECRCSNPGTCPPLKHILQDCAGVPVVDTLLHWANPGGPYQAKAECRDNTTRTDCTGK